MEIQSLHQHTPFPIKTGMWNVKHWWTFWGSREVCQGILKGPSVKIPIRSTPQDHSMHDMIFTTPGRQFTIQSPFDLMRWCQISKTTKKTYVSSCFFTYLSYFSVIPQMIYHALSNYLASCCWKKHLGISTLNLAICGRFCPKKAGQLCGVGHPSLSWDVEVWLSVESWKGMASRWRWLGPQV